MFDGLILASKTPEVNTAYYPKKKGENGDKYPILTIWTTFAPRAREESSPRGLFLFAPVGHRGCSAAALLLAPHRVGTRQRGIFSFSKENIPLTPPRERTRGEPLDPRHWQFVARITACAAQCGCGVHGFAMNPCELLLLSTAPYYREARVTVARRQTACRMRHCCARRSTHYQDGTHCR